MAKYILVNLENKSVQGMDIENISCLSLSNDKNINALLQGHLISSTKLTKEERKAFKEAANKLIDIYDKEDWATFDCKIPHDTVKEIFNAIYCKADVDLTRSMCSTSCLYPKTVVVRAGSRSGGKTVSSWCFDQIKTQPSLDKIYINVDKEIVTAKKDNDEIIKVQTSHGDEFDPYIGAALAYCYKQFGSKAAFRKAVDKITPKPKKKKKVVKHDVFPETGTDAIEDLRKGIEDFGNFVSSLSDAIRGGDLSVKIIDDNDKIWKKIDGEMVECEVFKQDTYEVGDEVLLNKDSPWCPGWVVTVDTRCCAYSPKDNASTVYHVTTLDMNEKLLVYPKHIAGKVVPKK